MSTDKIKVHIDKLQQALDKDSMLIQRLWSELFRLLSICNEKKIQVFREDISLETDHDQFFKNYSNQVSKRPAIDHSIEHMQSSVNQILKNSQGDFFSIIAELRSKIAEQESKISNLKQEIERNKISLLPYAMQQIPQQIPQQIIPQTPITPVMQMQMMPSQPLQMPIQVAQQHQGPPPRSPRSRIESKKVFKKQRVYEDVQVRKEKIQKIKRMGIIMVYLLLAVVGILGIIFGITALVTNQMNVEFNYEIVFLCVGLASVTGAILCFSLLECLLAKKRKYSNIHDILSGLGWFCVHAVLYSVAASLSKKGSVGWAWYTLGIATLTSIGAVLYFFYRVPRFKHTKPHITRQGGPFAWVLVISSMFFVGFIGLVGAYPYYFDSGLHNPKVIFCLSYILCHVIILSALCRHAIVYIFSTILCTLLPFAWSFATTWTIDRTYENSPVIMFILMIVVHSIIIHVPNRQRRDVHVICTVVIFVQIFLIQILGVIYNHNMDLFSDRIKIDLPTSMYVLYLLYIPAMLRGLAFILPPFLAIGVSIVSPPFGYLVWVLSGFSLLSFVIFYRRPAYVEFFKKNTMKVVDIEEEREDNLDENQMKVLDVPDIPQVRNRAITSPGKIVNELACWNCPDCSTKNPMIDNACNSCHHKIPNKPYRICDNCKQKLLVDDLFCRKCGNKQTYDIKRKTSIQRTESLTPGASPLPTPKSPTTTKDSIKNELEKLPDFNFKNFNMAKFEFKWYPRSLWLTTIMIWIAWVVFTHVQMDSGSWSEGDKIITLTAAPFFTLVGVFYDLRRNEHSIFNKIKWAQKEPNQTTKHWSLCVSHSLICALIATGSSGFMNGDKYKGVENKSYVIVCLIFQGFIVLGHRFFYRRAKDQEINQREIPDDSKSRNLAQRALNTLSVIYRPIGLLFSFYIILGVEGILHSLNFLIIPRPGNIDVEWMVFIWIVYLCLWSWYGLLDQPPEPGEKPRTGLFGLIRTPFIAFLLLHAEMTFYIYSKDIEGLYWLIPAFLILVAIPIELFSAYKGEIHYRRTHCDFNPKHSELLSYLTCLVIISYFWLCIVFILMSTVPSLKGYAGIVFFSISLIGMLVASYFSEKPLPDEKDKFGFTEIFMYLSILFIGFSELLCWKVPGKSRGTCHDYAPGNAQMVIGSCLFLWAIVSFICLRLERGIRFRFVAGILSTVCLFAGSFVVAFPLHGWVQVGVFIALCIDHCLPKSITPPLLLIYNLVYFIVAENICIYWGENCHQVNPPVLILGIGLIIWALTCQIRLHFYENLEFRQSQGKEWIWYIWQAINCVTLFVGAMLFTQITKGWLAFSIYLLFLSDHLILAGKSLTSVIWLPLSLSCVIGTEIYSIYVDERDNHEPPQMILCLCLILFGLTLWLRSERENRYENIKYLGSVSDIGGGVVFLVGILGITHITDCWLTTVILVIILIDNIVYVMLKREHPFTPSIWLTLMLPFILIGEAIAYSKGSFNTSSYREGKYPELYLSIHLISWSFVQHLVLTKNKEKELKSVRIVKGIASVLAGLAATYILTPVTNGWLPCFIAPLLVFVAVWSLTGQKTYGSIASLIVVFQTVLTLCTVNDYYDDIGKVFVSFFITSIASLILFMLAGGSFWSWDDKVGILLKDSKHILNKIKIKNIQNDNEIGLSENNKEIVNVTENLKPCEILFYTFAVLSFSGFYITFGAYCYFSLILVIIRTIKQRRLILFLLTPFIFTTYIAFQIYIFTNYNINETLNRIAITLLVFTCVIDLIVFICWELSHSFWVEPSLHPPGIKKQNLDKPLLNDPTGMNTAAWISLVSIIVVLSIFSRDEIESYAWTGMGVSIIYFYFGFLSKKFVHRIIGFLFLLFSGILGAVYLISSGLLVIIDGVLFLIYILSSLYQIGVCKRCFQPAEEDKAAVNVV